MGTNFRFGFSHCFSLSVSIDFVSVLLFQGNNNASGQQIDQKSGQWFGATVRSSGPNGAIVVSFFQFFCCFLSFFFLFQVLIETEAKEMNFNLKIE